MTFDPMAGVNQINNKLWKQQQEMLNHVTENNRRNIEREEEKVQLLRDIKESNFQVVELVRKNNEINKELFDLFQELNTIMVANSEVEANNILGNVVETANKANETWGTIQAIISYGKMLGKLTFPESGLFD